MSYRILFVDDEKNILSSIRRVFMDEDDFELIFASSGQEALAELENNSASVIVSDMRMPQMDGVAFLKKSREIAPEAIRMILSGYADVSSIMQAINDGHIWRYITKPWIDTDLILALKNAVAFYEKSTEVKNLLLELGNLNHDLEERVKERTRQLNERDSLLQMIVENEPLENIIKCACEAISRQVSGDPVFVSTPILDNVCSSFMPPAHLAVKAADSIKNKKNILDLDFISVLLSKGDSILGAVVLDNLSKKEPFEVLKSIETFSSIISIALSQQKAIDDMPDLLNKLENIAGEL